jgi:hypothetical protein
MTLAQVKFQGSASHSASGFGPGSSFGIIDVRATHDTLVWRFHEGVKDRAYCRWL